MMFTVYHVMWLPLLVPRNHDCVYNVMLALVPRDVVNFLL